MSRQWLLSHQDKVNVPSNKLSPGRRSKLSKPPHAFWSQAHSTCRTELTRSWESPSLNGVNKPEVRLARLEYQRSAAVTASGRERVLEVELAHSLLIERDRDPALAQGDAVVQRQWLSGHRESQKNTDSSPPRTIITTARVLL